MNWLLLTEERQLADEIDERSSDKAIDGILIFKHSTRCSISSMAKSRLERNWDLDSEKLPVYYLDLLNYRNVSNEIAAHYDIEHQSPQVLIIKDGKCVYSATHSEIDASAIREYFNK